MSKKARRRPSWKNPRRYYTVSHYRIVGFLGRYQESIRKRISDKIMKDLEEYWLGE